MFKLEPTSWIPIYFFCCIFAPSHWLLNLDLLGWGIFDCICATSSGKVLLETIEQANHVDLIVVLCAESLEPLVND